MLCHNFINSQLFGGGKESAFSQPIVHKEIAFTGVQVTEKGIQSVGTKIAQTATEFGE